MSIFKGLGSDVRAIRSIWLVIMGAMLIAMSFGSGGARLSTGAPARTYVSTGGTSGDWVKSYEITGTAYMKHWSVSGEPGNQTATLIVTDMYPYLSHVDPHWTFTGGGTSYLPFGATQPVKLLNEMAMTMKIKTIFTWNNPNVSPPESLKLKLSGNAFATYVYDQGYCQAYDGISDSPVTSYSSFPYPSGGSVSSGNHYRKFPVTDGKVTIMTEQSSVANSYGMFTAATNFDADVTDWSLDIVSDRDETFRRVKDAYGAPQRISNRFEDDGITPRGGDGFKYGDSVLSNPSVFNGFDWDFNSAFALTFDGVWDNLATYGQFTSDHLLGSGGGNYVGLNSWPGLHLAAGIEDSPGGAPFNLTVTGNATDPVNQISDNLIYKMKIHQVLEKDVESASTYNQDFIYWAKDTSPFYDFQNRDAYKPFHAADTVVNSSKLPMLVNVSWSKTGEATYGYEETATAGESLTLEAIIVNFGSSFTNSISISSSITESGSGSVTIPRGYRLEIWGCPSGNLTRHTDTRNNQNGYKCDAIDYTLDTFDIVRKVWLRSNNAPLNVIPHLGD